MVIYTWRTKKTKDGYRYNVVKMTPLKNPNKMGHYVSTTIIKTGVRNTRAKAMSIGKKWSLYLKQQHKRRLK